MYYSEISLFIFSKDFLPIIFPCGFRTTPIFLGFVFGYASPLLTPDLPISLKVLSCMMYMDVKF